MISLIVGIVVILMGGTTLITYACLCAAAREDEWMEKYEREKGSH